MNPFKNDPKFGYWFWHFVALVPGILMPMLIMVLSFRVLILDVPGGRTLTNYLAVVSLCAGPAVAALFIIRSALKGPDYE